MILIEASIGIGKVDVLTSSDGGLPTVEWAKRLADKVVSVSDTAPPPIRDQAQAFKLAVQRASLHYMQEAVRAERDRIIVMLEKEGLPEVAAAVRDMEKK